MSTTAPQVSLGAVCCAPLTREPLSAADAERLAAVLKAVAEPTRLRLLSLVAAHEGAEACVCDLTEPVGLTQPTVSHHLKVLVDAGLLERERRGVWAYYRLVPDTLDALAGVLTASPGPALPRDAPRRDAALPREAPRRDAALPREARRTAPEPGLSR